MGLCTSTILYTNTYTSGCKHMPPKYIITPAGRPLSTMGIPVGCCSITLQQPPRNLQMTIYEVQ